MKSLLFCLALTTAAQAGVTLKKLDDRLRVEIDGQLFTEYIFKGVEKPYFYPIIGPGGANIVRDFPSKIVPGDSQDHNHHRAVVHGHGDVNGVDFWTEKRPKSGRTVHEDFVEIESGENAGWFRSRNRLTTKEDRVIGTDERTVRVLKTPHGPMIDFEITHHASHGELVFGDTKEGSMAIRVAESMVMRYSAGPKERRQVRGSGRIVNSEGYRDDDAWGRRATWIDYHGLIDGKMMGIAMFDHPKNPRHPTWWHVRDYGLMAANPFGAHDFEKLENAEAGRVKLPAGQKLTFRYRFYFHAGDEKDAQVADRYREYATQS